MDSVRKAGMIMSFITPNDIQAVIETNSQNRAVKEKQFFLQGGTIFLHVFGTYFGLAASFTSGRMRDHDVSEDKQNSSPTSDLFSFLGTFVLWVYWPSFNAYVVEGAARHRAILNTYVSLCASTVTTLISSAVFGV